MFTDAFNGDKYEVVQGQVQLTIPAGYALARFPVPGKELLFVFLLLALIIPYQALLTPIFLMFAQLKLTNTLIGLAIVHTAIQLPFSLYIMRNSFEAVPRELEEAAVTDGANSWQTLISIFILIIGFCMSELVSAFPTSGGIYWWASKLGGPRAGFYTGWLNLIGLLGIVASVVYGAAFFLNTTISLFDESYAGSFLGGDYIKQQFFWFIVLMVVVTLLNLFKTSILGIINNISVWWHVIGASVVILIMIFGPSSHQSVSFVFTERINNSGFGDGTSGLIFWVLGISAALLWAMLMAFEKRFFHSLALKFRKLTKIENFSLYTLIWTKTVAILLHHR